MAKIDVDLTKQILLRNISDMRLVAEVMQDIELELQAQEEERAELSPTVKKQFVVLVSDPDGALAERDLTGWVLQMPEDESVMTAPERVLGAVREFNSTPKGRRMPVLSVGEACETVPAKIFKEEQLWVKTKIPLLLVPVQNRIHED